MMKLIRLKKNLLSILKSILNVSLGQVQLHFLLQILKSWSKLQPEMGKSVSPDADLILQGNSYVLSFAHWSQISGK